ncbi:ABC transporter ATP-binding protein [Alkalicella caledoniensis]|uniref:ABC transporter ATP-binding protein n=1 Tax=Alkalicella caledoniensis TaxID=2731377 RepID=A0A7G9W763_ALKCA|nr:ABC transporter ATP-binding protein [Alkalicella caledoniensis]QNO14525.1 ABC transporter ATP-binding protein [Alkalicella caledoniensis]
MSFVLVNDIQKSYNRKPAVSGVSFSIKPGETFGLLGPNGAGKTTTISMLATLLKPDSGDILVGDNSVVTNPKGVKKLLGYVPQDIALYTSLSAEENLKFWGRMYGLKGDKLQERTKKVLELVGLTERAKDKVDSYSGGMKRRINIAVGLLHEPKLLLMDEPTVGVDPQSRNKILETVKDLSKQGMTIIYTSHYMEEVEFLCDKVAIMDSGRIKGMGTVQELKELVGNKDLIKMDVSKEVTENEKNSLYELFNSSLEVKEQEISILVENGAKEMTNILGKISNLGLEITSVDIQKPNLEKVFLHLTGKSLRD